MKSSVTTQFVTRPFLVQYVSLMLIVFTFCLGAFQRARPPAVRSSPALISSSSSMPVSSSLRFSGVFVDDGDGIKIEPLEAVLRVLQLHDLDAEIEVYGPTFEQAVGRSVSLTRAFVKQNIAAETVRIYAVQAQQAEELSVIFSKSESLTPREEAR